MIARKQNLATRPKHKGLYVKLLHQSKKPDFLPSLVLAEIKYRSNKEEKVSLTINQLSQKTGFSPDAVKKALHHLIKNQFISRLLFQNNKPFFCMNPQNEIEGNGFFVYDHWLKEIQTEKKTPDAPAILILANYVYWCIRNETTIVKKDIPGLVKKTGYTRLTISKALDKLEGGGYISKTEMTTGGARNVLYNVYINKALPSEMCIETTQNGQKIGFEMPNNYTKNASGEGVNIQRGGDKYTHEGGGKYTLGGGVNIHSEQPEQQNKNNPIGFKIKTISKENIDLAKQSIVNNQKNQMAKNPLKVFKSIIKNNIKHEELASDSFSYSDSDVQPNTIQKGESSNLKVCTTAIKQVAGGGARAGREIGTGLVFNSGKVEGIAKSEEQIGYNPQTRTEPKHAKDDNFKQFSAFYEAYKKAGGLCRDLKTEYELFKRTQGAYFREILATLPEKFSKQVSVLEKKKKNGEFAPPLQMLKNYIWNKGWEIEYQTTQTTQQGTIGVGLRIVNTLDGQY